jgi:two-component sensor histidine kinase
MEKNSLFFKEEQVIREGKDLLKSPEFQDRACTEHYERLLRHYERMFGQMQRIVRIADGFEDELRTSLQEKEVLLREVHHRVKNNLASIIGLIHLQRKTMGNAAAAGILSDLASRIMSMALIHETLYQSDKLTRIDCQRYFSALGSHLISAAASRGHVRCEVEATGVEMNLDTAVPCGMIVNELITNAIKHAFPQGKPGGGTGSCTVSVSVQGDGPIYTLAVADNGIGLPPATNWETAKTLGLKLVKMLAEHQLGGRIEVDCTAGTRFTLNFGSRHNG